MQKITIVTGCSSGIGYETALELARNNYKVYATMRNLNKKGKLENQASSEQLNIDIIQLDVTDDVSIKNAINHILQKEGQIDVLVNNAGYGLLGAIEDLDIDDVKRQFETDFFGPVRIIIQVIPIMKKQNFGKIINISSLAGRVGFGFTSAYVTSKFALEGFNDSIRQELLGTNISMSLIEPGAVNTRFPYNMQLPKNPKISLERKEFLEIMRKQGEKILAKSFEPTEVAQKIISVLNEKEPKPRYLVGRDAERIIIDKQRMMDLEFEKSVAKFFTDMMQM